MKRRTSDLTPDHRQTCILRGVAAPLRLSVFTVMVPDLTPEEAAAELAASGYDGVEWRVTTVPEHLRDHPPSFWGNNRCTLAPTLEEARRAREVAAAHRLAIPNVGAYPAPGDADACETVLRFAEACDAPQVRVLPFPMITTYEDAFDATRAYLETVEALARQFARRALIEIHMNTIAPRASLARRLLDGFDPECIGVIHDAGNMAFEGFEDYRIGIEVLGPYLAHVHVKNARFGPPDDNFDALFTALPPRATTDGSRSRTSATRARPAPHSATTMPSCGARSTGPR